MPPASAICEMASRRQLAEIRHREPLRHRSAASEGRAGTATKCTHDEPGTNEVWSLSRHRPTSGTRIPGGSHGLCRSIKRHNLLFFRQLDKRAPRSCCPRSGSPPSRFRQRCLRGRIARPFRAASDPVHSPPESTRWIEPAQGATTESMNILHGRFVRSILILAALTIHSSRVFAIDACIEYENRASWRRHIPAQTDVTSLQLLGDYAFTSEECSTFRIHRLQRASKCIGRWSRSCATCTGIARVRHAAGLVAGRSRCP